MELAEGLLQLHERFILMVDDQLEGKATFHEAVKVRGGRSMGSSGSVEVEGTSGHASGQLCVSGHQIVTLSWCANACSAG